MDISEYQKMAWETAIYPNKGSNYIYTLLGLNGETGEISEKFKKIIRDDGGKISDENKLLIKKEIGGVLWYISALSMEMGFDLNDVAQANIEKLNSRKERGKLNGSGDER